MALAGPQALAGRLLEATNNHDLDAIVDCFAPDYLNETPAHPARGFRGAAQVRRNWAQILAGVPDLRAEIVRTATRDDTLWIEWAMDGTRRDGAPYAMRGVTIFGVRDGRVDWVRFYLEPVEQGGGDVDEAVREAFSAQAGPTRPAASRP